jgi:hypothetical protein
MLNPIIINMFVDKTLQHYKKNFLEDNFLV